jgi:hypothetical protein
MNHYTESEIERRRAWGRTKGKKLAENGDWERIKNLPESRRIRLAANRKRGKQLVKSGEWELIRSKGAHCRWHRDRGIQKLGCEFCQAE